MKFPWTIAALAVAITPGASIEATPRTDFDLFSGVDVDAAFDENSIRANLNELKLPVDIQYERKISDYIKTYLMYGKNETQTLLNRTELYFPLFERYLKEYGLPVELKYLSMIESELRSDALSGASAAGLWQLMPATATEFGLTISEHVDERYDPVKSTKAALTMLSSLYQKYCDWKLVLAAYNSGAGRVNKAIRMAGTTDYEVVKQYLPLETQNYLPKYVAAAYVGHYFEDYGLNPKDHKIDFGKLTVLTVYTKLTFNEVAEMTGLSVHAIRSLNPAYLQDVLPRTTNGNFLVVPEKVAATLKDYLKELGQSKAAVAQLDPQYQPWLSFPGRFPIVGAAA